MVVDDSRLQRRILSSMLTRWGYQVIEADTAPKALQLCDTQMPDMIFSDWMMPEMTGLDFCKTMRKRYPNTYSYFILLTSKAEKNDIAQGLESGADDFLTKPVNASELRARITAGGRILSMQRELQNRNDMITDTLDELRKLYTAIDADLVEAQKLQQSLVRVPQFSTGPYRISQLLRSSGHVGGDLVGFFPAGPSHLGLFGIDVSGHGISSALFTARLAGYLSSDVAEHNIALELDHRGQVTPRQVDKVLENMNQRVLDEMDTDLYFTMSLASLNLDTGQVALSQAGHPHPMIQHADGAFSLCGSTGVPIGLLPDMTYDRVMFQISAGDRLIITSDGVTECPNPQGELLDDAGLQRILSRHRDQTGMNLIQAILHDLEHYAQTPHFPDDVSILLVEYLDA